MRSRPALALLPDLLPPHLAGLLLPPTVVDFLLLLPPTVAALVIPFLLTVSFSFPFDKGENALAPSAALALLTP